ncbi:MAG: 1-phosphofructokinase [Methanomassiliicoccus sp.]|nr:1-phosphofructokinase [Methanomassiliicoccus sp.]
MNDRGAAGTRVYTLALNPAIDRTFWVDRIDYEESNRVRQECRYPGGKGIDVSRVLTGLGVPNIALGFSGGYTGHELEHRLACEGVATDLIPVSGETRTNVIVNESSTGRQILLTASGPEVTRQEMDALIAKIQRLDDAFMVAIGGSLPPGAGADTYGRLITMLRGQGIITFLDADGEAMRHGVAAGPDYIKPNRHELGEMVGRELGSTEEVIGAAEEVQAQGVGTVLASMGAEGMVMVDGERAYWASPPAVEAVNNVGVGDSAVAGFIYGLASGMGAVDCLRHGTAAGTATALKPGTARASRADILAMLPRIRTKELEREAYVRA